MAHRAPSAASGVADWSPDTVPVLARALGVPTLSERHWKVIAACREETARRGRVPSSARLVALTGIPLVDLRRLFAGRPDTVVARLAGVARVTCDAPATPATGIRRTPS